MRLIAFLLLVFQITYSSAATLTGRTFRVTDGDTIVILSEGNVQHKIRLQGIDAPERGQAFGTKSKENLSEAVSGRFTVASAMLHLSGCASYKAGSLVNLQPEFAPYSESQSGVTLSVKKFSAEDSKRILDRDVIQKGYQ